MENVRTFQAAVMSRSLALGVVMAFGLAILGHQRVLALALLAGTVVCLFCLFHIATGFWRLAQRGKVYLPFVMFESVLRVLVAGAAPFVIVGRGPALGYLTYLAGFVAPLAVALLSFRQQIKADSVKQGAAN